MPHYFINFRFKLQSCKLFDKYKKYGGSDKRSTLDLLLIEKSSCESNLSFPKFSVCFINHKKLQKIKLHIEQKLGTEKDKTVLLSVSLTEPFKT